jgi:hypothetical protein
MPSAGRLATMPIETAPPTVKSSCPRKRAFRFIGTNDWIPAFAAMTQQTELIANGF